MREYYRKNREQVRKKQQSYCRNRYRVIYNTIIARCYLSSHKSYDRYGGRGIRMCQEWLDSFEVFRDWLLANGWKQGLHIHRTDKDGDYSPQNCIIVTAAEHVRGNDKLTKLTWKKVAEIRHLYIEGFRVSDLAKEFGISHGQLYKIVTNRSWVG